MKNKGFTLIELLAVIVVLVILALVAVPTIIRVVDKSRESAAVAGATGYLDAVEKQIAINLLDSDDNNNIPNGEISVLDLTNIYNVKVKGTMPTNDGTVVIENGMISSAELTVNGYDISCTNSICKSIGKSSVKTLTINNKNITEIIKGSSLTLETETNIRNKPIVWSSSDTSVATVSDGVVMGLKTGEVTITATIGKLSDSIDLTIIDFYDVLSLGDYIKMTPTSTEYEITTSQTGYTSNQIINPSLLDLWRVIKINDDGTFECISAYTQGTTSGEDIYFGVNSSVFKTNAELIAQQYMNSDYITSVRFISNGNGFETKNSESLSNFSDVDLVSNSLGTLVANSLDDKATAKSYYTGINASYSRDGCYMACDCPGGSKPHCWWNGYGIYTISDAGSVSYRSQYSYWHVYDPNTGSSSSNVNAQIRPIITFKPEIQVVSGDGKTEDTAYILK